MRAFGFWEARRVPGHEVKSSDESDDRVAPTYNVGALKAQEAFMSHARAYLLRESTASCCFATSTSNLGGTHDKLLFRTRMILPAENRPITCVSFYCPDLLSSWAMERIALAFCLQRIYV